MGKKARIAKLSDRDWDNLLTLTAGYLSVTNGDVRRAMSKALAAHHDLIAAAKLGVVGAEIHEGRVTLVVPEDGGMALKFEPK